MHLVRCCQQLHLWPWVGRMRTSKRSRNELELGEVGRSVSSVQDASCWSSRHANIARPIAMSPKSSQKSVWGRGPLLWEWGGQEPIKLRNTSIIASQLALPGLFLLQFSIRKGLEYVLVLPLKAEGENTGEERWMGTNTPHTSQCHFSFSPST